MKQLFVAATRQNDGKTVVSLGLLRAFQRRGQRVGYMKPVGQSYRIVDGKKIDKDVVLMNTVVGFDDAMCDMSPIAVPRGFTEDYIKNPNRDALATSVRAAYERVAHDKDFFLLEGTGHAGVGSVFDMSNADVAKLLGTKVILVSQGGIGKPIDEIMMNKSKFDVMGAEVAGVIVNKIDPSRYEKIAPVVTQGFHRLGLEVFGVLPYDDYLSNPSVAEIQDELGGELISGHAGLNNTVSRFMIGDMRPHDALDGFAGSSLLLVPGNREEMILAAFSWHILGTTLEPPISGIVFTCGIPPHPKILELLSKTSIPLMLVKEDTFSVASSINSMIVKLRAEDTGKIEKIDAMIEKHVDLERLVAAL
jgi:BioD-like phosphotransacetylase family protein